MYMYFFNIYFESTSEACCFFQDFLKTTAWIYLTPNRAWKTIRRMNFCDSVCFSRPKWLPVVGFGDAGWWIFSSFLKHLTFQDVLPREQTPEIVCNYIMSSNHVWSHLTCTYAFLKWVAKNTNYRILLALSFVSNGFWDFKWISNEQWKNSSCLGHKTSKSRETFRSLVTTHLGFQWCGTPTHLQALWLGKPWFSTLLKWIFWAAKSFRQI